MKAFKILIVLLVLVCVFASCEKAPDTEATKAPEATAGVPTALADSFSFTYKGTVIQPGEKADAVVSALGEPLSYYESQSCAFEGLDKIYTYTSFVLYTFPKGDADYVYALTLSDDTIATPEGVCVFDTADKVKSTYGDNGTVSGESLIYIKGNVKLTFVIKDGEVTSIQYDINE